MASQLTALFCGDVMTGRGVDQILPHPGDPTLRETYMRDARRYVELAAAKNGRIPRPVEFGWPWGDALQIAAHLAPDIRLINLETSVSRYDKFAAGKSIHYRMSPENMPCLTAFHPNVCALANNHVLDFGRPGLVDTLDALQNHNIGTAGAGVDLERAREPAVIPVDGSTRVVALACGTSSSGIPAAWAADQHSPGIFLLPNLSDKVAGDVGRQLIAAKQPGDIAIVSIHWGSNWGYEIPPYLRRFAHRLIDAGVDVVHGHSSHHPRPVEIYKHKLVMYGCGDFINDYEGIGGYEKYRPDLRLMYVAELETGTGRLIRLAIVPLQVQRMALHLANRADAVWLADTIARDSRLFTFRISVDAAGLLVCRPASAG